VGSGVGATAGSAFADSDGMDLYDAVGFDSLVAGGALVAGAAGGLCWLAVLSVAAGLATGCGDWFSASFSLALSVRQPNTNSRSVNWAASSKAFERMTIISHQVHPGHRPSCSGARWPGP
jgi:hypothetical protein